MNVQEKVEAAAEAFYGALSSDFWEEYGINLEDTRKGMLSALKAIGLLSATEAKRVRRSWELEEQKKDRERKRVEAERRAGLTEEQRKREDSHINMMRSMSKVIPAKIVDSRFASSPTFNFIRRRINE